MCKSPIRTFSNSSSLTLFSTSSNADGGSLPFFSTSSSSLTDSPSVETIDGISLINELSQLKSLTQQNGAPNIIIKTADHLVT